MFFSTSVHWSDEFYHGQRINIIYVTSHSRAVFGRYIKVTKKGVQTFFLQSMVQNKPTQRDVIINMHTPLHQFTIFACGGAPSKITRFSPWPPPSNVTSQQRPVRVGVSVESEEKDGCGTKGEVDKSQSRCLRIAR